MPEPKSGHNAKSRKRLFMDGSKTGNFQGSITGQWESIPGVDGKVYTLLRKKDDSVYLVRKTTAPDGRLMYEPTGYVILDDYVAAMKGEFGKRGGQNLLELHVAEGIVINAAQPFSRPEYHHGDDNHHVAMSILVTTDITGAVSASKGGLAWMKVSELREAGKKRELTPALLQCMMLGMM